jgi:hypothetical protein
VIELGREICVKDEHPEKHQRPSDVIELRIIIQRKSSE